MAFRYPAFFLLLLFCAQASAQQSRNPLIEKGWAALTQDDESYAFKLFGQAYEKAEKANNTAGKAEASLYLGICAYGSSPDKGMQYATRALSFYEELEKVSHIWQRWAGRGVYS